MLQGGCQCIGGWLSVPDWVVVSVLLGGCQCVAGWLSVLGLMNCQCVT